MSCGKLKYGEQAAKDAAKKIRKEAKKYFGLTNRKEKRAYKCPICHSWHLTSISLDDWIVIERKYKEKIRNARINRDKEIWEIVKLKPTATRRGTVEGEFREMETIIQNNFGALAYRLPSNEPIRNSMTEYASQVSATDKNRIKELEAENEILKMENSHSKLVVDEAKREIDRLKYISQKWTDDLVLEFSANVVLGHTDGKLLGEYMKEFKANNNL